MSGYIWTRWNISRATDVIEKNVLTNRSIRNEIDTDVSLRAERFFEEHIFDTLRSSMFHRIGIKHSVHRITIFYKRILFQKVIQRDIVHQTTRFFTKLP